jgi:hypothetical protein
MKVREPGQKWPGVSMSGCCPVSEKQHAQVSRMSVTKLQQCKPIRVKHVFFPRLFP